MGGIVRIYKIIKLWIIKRKIKKALNKKERFIY